MSRLTSQPFRKKLDDSLENYKVRRFNGEEWETAAQNAINKLGRLEDIEEELGCPLEVIGKVFLDWGFVDETGLGVQITGMKIDGDSSKYFIAVNGDLYDLKDYQKTWWLKGENK